jgi:hypothetical protein
MNVITENEIVYINSLNSEDAETFLYIDGKSTKDEIIAFQQWMNAIKNTKVEENGEWSTAMDNAIKKGFGKEYDKFVKFGQEKDKKIQVFEGNKIKAKEPSTAEKERAQKMGLVWDNVKKGYVKAQELGIIDAILGKLGITPRTSDVPEVGVDMNVPQGGEVKKGMSTTTKVLIGVGLVAVIGLVIYSTKKK